MRVWRSFFKSKYIMHTYTCYGVVCRRSAAFSCQHSGISTHADAYYTVIGGTQRSHWHTASFMCLFFFSISLWFLIFFAAVLNYVFYFFLDAVLHFLSLSLFFFCMVVTERVTVSKSICWKKGKRKHFVNLWSGSARRLSYSHCLLAPYKRKIQAYFQCQLQECTMFERLWCIFMLFICFHFNMTKFSCFQRYMFAAVSGCN